MLDELRVLRAALESELKLFGPLATLGPEVAAPEAVTPEAPAAAEPAPVPPTGATEPMDSPDLFGAGPTSPYERIAALIPADSPLRGMSTLDQVATYVATTELIALDRTRTKPVFGVGNPEARLMVIGEAPGADEDRQGEPFVGRAGQLLNKILQSVGFEREEVYITNILKSRPPGNRDPQPDEVEAHIPILYKQIALIRPLMLLCVGRIAGNALLGRSAPLASLRDRLNDFHGLPVVITYHPAALLRNEQWKRPTWEDMKMLRRHFDQLVEKSA